jgi:hypothetical protein
VHVYREVREAYVETIYIFRCSICGLTTEEKYIYEPKEIRWITHLKPSARAF